MPNKNHHTEEQGDDVWYYDVLVGDGEPVAHESLLLLHDTIRELIERGVTERVHIRTTKLARKDFEALPQTASVLNTTE